MGWMGLDQKFERDYLLLLARFVTEARLGFSNGNFRVLCFSAGFAVGSSALRALEWGLREREMGL
jgi:hypothetical protein